MSFSHLVESIKESRMMPKKKERAEDIKDHPRNKNRRESDNGLLHHLLLEYLNIQMAADG